MAMREIGKNTALGAFVQSAVQSAILLRAAPLYELQRLLTESAPVMPSPWDNSLELLASGL